MIDEEGILHIFTQEEGVHRVTAKQRPERSGDTNPVINS